MTLEYVAPKDPLLVTEAAVDRDGIYITSAYAGGFAVSQRAIRMHGGRAGIITDMNPDFEAQTISDVLLTIDKGDKSKTLWGVRRHRLVSPTTMRVRVVDKTRPGSPSSFMGEHAFYDEIASGEALYEDCSCLNIPAQALQIRLTGNRNDPKWKNPRRIIVRNFVGEEVGQARGAGRAAFAISIKDAGPEGEVEIFNPQLETVQQRAVAKRSDGTIADSFAGLCVEYCKTLKVSGGYINFKNPKMHAVQLYDFGNKAAGRTGPEEIDFQGVTLGSGNHITVRLDDTTRKVNIEGCSGDGEIVVYKRAADGTYRPNIRRPITQGYRF